MSSKQLVILSFGFTITCSIVMLVVLVYKKTCIESKI